MDKSKVIRMSAIVFSFAIILLCGKIVYAIPMETQLIENVHVIESQPEIEVYIGKTSPSRTVKYGYSLGQEKNRRDVSNQSVTGNYYSFSDIKQTILQNIRSISKDPSYKYEWFCATYPALIPRESAGSDQ